MSEFQRQFWLERLTSLSAGRSFLTVQASLVGRHRFIANVEGEGRGGRPTNNGRGTISATGLHEASHMPNPTPSWPVCSPSWPVCQKAALFLWGRHVLPVLRFPHAPLDGKDLARWEGSCVRQICRQALLGRDRCAAPSAFGGMRALR